MAFAWITPKRPSNGFGDEKSESILQGEGAKFRSHHATAQLSDELSPRHVAVSHAGRRRDGQPGHALSNPRPRARQLASVAALEPAALPRRHVVVGGLCGPEKPGRQDFQAVKVEEDE